MKSPKDRKRYEEDVTENGEFIPTFHCWMTLEEQKRNANYLVNMEKINKKREEEERFKDWQLLILAYNVKRL